MTTSKLTLVYPRSDTTSPIEVNPNYKTPPSPASYRVVPADTPPSDAIWRIEIAPLNEHNDPLALELRGDTIVGSLDGEDGPDVNLVGWNGWNRGVSRRHLLMRPTLTKLFLLDLRSTNGTYVNGLPLDVGWAYAVRDGDLISLGKLNLRLSILTSPK